MSIFLFFHFFAHYFVYTHFYIKTESLDAKNLKKLTSRHHKTPYILIFSFYKLETSKNPYHDCYFFNFFQNTHFTIKI